jgi:hypothetical protein
MTVAVVAVVAEATVEAMAVLCLAVAPMLAVMLAHTVVAQAMLSTRLVAPPGVQEVHTIVAVLLSVVARAATAVWD